MLAEQFVEKYKELDKIQEDFRVSSYYNTTNKDYIWRQDTESRFICLQRTKAAYGDYIDPDNGKLCLSIIIDGPEVDDEEDEFYSKHGYEEEILALTQDDEESDDEFYKECIDFLTRDNLHLTDIFIERFDYNAKDYHNIIQTVESPIEFVK